jgi:type II secretory pathway component PulF
MAVDALDHSVTEALRAWRAQHGAGIGVADALRLCATVCKAGDRCFLEASERGERGESIEALLRALAPLLSEAERAAITAGWNGGRAESVMDVVIAQRELWFNTRRMVKSKLMLPVAVLLVASLVIPLPGLIGGSIGFGGYLFSAAMPMLAAYVVWSVCFGAMSRTERSESGGVIRPPSLPDRLKMSLPIVRDVERSRNLAEFSACLSSLLSAGVVITQALETCSRCQANGLYREEIARCMALVRRGEPLSTGMTRQELWPFEYVASLQTGEISGTLDAVLMRLSLNFRERYTRAVGILADWLPRLLYGIVALFIIYKILTMALNIARMSH